MHIHRAVDFTKHFYFQQYSVRNRDPSWCMLFFWMGWNHKSVDFQMPSISPYIYIYIYTYIDICTQIFIHKTWYITYTYIHIIFLVSLSLSVVVFVVIHRGPGSRGPRPPRVACVRPSAACVAAWRLRNLAHQTTRHPEILDEDIFKYR